MADGICLSGVSGLDVLRDGRDIVMDSKTGVNL